MFSASPHYTKVSTISSTWCYVHAVSMILYADTLPKFTELGDKGNADFSDLIIDDNFLFKKDCDLSSIGDKETKKSLSTIVSAIKNVENHLNNFAAKEIGALAASDLNEDISPFLFYIFKEVALLAEEYRNKEDLTKVYQCLFSEDKAHALAEKFSKKAPDYFYQLGSIVPSVTTDNKHTVKLESDTGAKVSIPTEPTDETYCLTAVMARDMIDVFCATDSDCLPRVMEQRHFENFGSDRPFEIVVKDSHASVAMSNGYAFEAIENFGASTESDLSFNTQGFASTHIANGWLQWCFGAYERAAKIGIVIAAAIAVIAATVALFGPAIFAAAPAAAAASSPSSSDSTPAAPSAPPKTVPRGKSTTKVTEKRTNPQVTNKGKASVMNTKHHKSLILSNKKSTTKTTANRKKTLNTHKI